MTMTTPPHCTPFGTEGYELLVDAASNIQLLSQGNGTTICGQLVPEHGFDTVFAWRSIPTLLPPHLHQSVEETSPWLLRTYSMVFAAQPLVLQNINVVPFSLVSGAHDSEDRCGQELRTRYK